MTAILAARSLRQAVSRGDDAAVQRIVSRPDLPLVAVELARLAPITVHPVVRRIAIAPELWKPDAKLKPHGTHAAFNRHKGRGEDPCTECKAGERTYQNGRPRPRKYVPPAADPVVVARFLDGEHVRLNDAERREAARVLAGRGVKPSAIALRVHAATRTVHRWLRNDAVSARLRMVDEKADTA